MISFQNYKKMKIDSKGWKSYCALTEERPEQFRPLQDLMIEKNIDKICSFEIETNKTIGVIYESKYNILIVDLVYDKSGNYFCYERILPATVAPAVVAITYHKGSFVLLNQARHSTRDYQYSFPRGYGEPGFSSEENVKKEVKEELGAEVIYSKYLGKVIADSGLSGNRVDVHFCEIGDINITEGYEGIVNCISVNRDELNRLISNGNINDGFTLAAITLYDNNMNN